MARRFHYTSAEAIQKLVIPSFELEMLGHLTRTVLLESKTSFKIFVAGCVAPAIPDRSWSTKSLLDKDAEPRDLFIMEKADQTVLEELDV